MLIIAIAVFFIRACLASPYGSAFAATVPSRNDPELGHNKTEHTAAH